MTPEGKVKAKIVVLFKKWRREGAKIYWFSPIGSVYGKAGVPDIIVCFHGAFIGIEVKAPGKIKNTTALQRHAHDEIRGALGKVILADNAEDVGAYFRNVFVGDKLE